MRRQGVCISEDALLSFRTSALLHTNPSLFLVRLVPPYIESLEPYKAGKPIAELQRELGIAHVTKLASNENPLGPSPRAIEALRHHLDDLHRYPNGGLDLREVLAARFRLKVGNEIGRAHV